MIVSILKFEPRTPRSLEDMILYLKDRSKTTEDGIFAIGCNPVHAALEMEFVQRLYFYDNLVHPYVQVIFAFDVGINLSLSLLRQIAIEIGQVLIVDRRQVFGAIHYLNTDKKHCHYILNYVSVLGELYRQNYSLWHYKQAVNEILGLYSLGLIKVYSNDRNCLPLAYDS